MKVLQKDLSCPRRLASRAQRGVWLKIGQSKRDVLPWMPACAGMTIKIVGLLFILFRGIDAHAAPNPPTRIVSLAPVATEFLFALGLGDRLVGVTTYCNRPKEARSITKIGGFADPQLEAIIKLKPDLVVATPFGNAKNVVLALQARGINTLAQTVDSLDDMRKFLTELGKTTSTIERAAQLQRTLDDKLAQLAGTLGKCSIAKIPLPPFPKGDNTLNTRRECSPKVLLLVSASPLIAAGPQTFAGEVLKHLGAQNIITALTPAWSVISLENLMRSPPDIVVITDGPAGIKPAQSALAPLLSKHKGKIRLFAPDKSILQRPGPYLIEDAKILLNAVQSPNV